MTTQEIFCVNHPRRSTLVRCSTCDSPICTDCMRESSVGMKCSDCARLPRRARRAAHPRFYVAAALVAFVLAGLIGGALTLMDLGLLGFLMPVLVGYAIGEAVRKVTKGAGQTAMRLLVGASVVLGLITGPLVIGLPLRYVIDRHAILGLLIAGAFSAYRAT